jgi:ribosomal protein L31
MDETMRELNTENLDQILEEARVSQEDNRLQALIPEKEVPFRQQAAAEAEAPAEEEPVPASEPEPEDIPEAAEEEIPAAEALTKEEHNAILTQDTIRLDDLQEVITMTNTREFSPLNEEDGVTDETIRLDDIAQAAILEELLAEHRAEQEARQKAETQTQKRETVKLEDEYNEEGFVTMPLIFLPKQRLRELKRKLVAGPEKRYYELVEQGVGKLQLAMLVCLLVIGLSAASAVVYQMNYVPENRMKLMVFGQILAMLLGALMGCQQMIEGVCELFRGRFSLNTMLLVTFLACCADGVLCLQELRVPICGAFTLEVFMALWAAYHKRTTEMGQMDTMRKAVRLDRLSKCPDYYNGKPAFVRSDGQVEDFTETYDQIPRPERVQNVFAAFSLLLSIGIAVLAGLRHGLSMGVQIFSTSLLVAVPASFFISITRPMAILERRLHRLGTVLCGWKGIKNLKGRCGFPLTDVDLFPNGAAKMNGVKFYGDRSPETVISYAAALMRVNGGNLAPIFGQLLANRNGIVYEAENVRFYGNGGIGGEVCEEPVLMGTLEFLKDMGVDIPDGVMVKHAVYLSIDGELSGLFAVSYARTKLTTRGVATICGYRKITPIIMAEDFMLTAPFLKERFGIRTRRAVFPDRELRRELSQKQAPEDAIPLALMTQEGLAPVAFAITGARALRTSWRMGLVIHILGGILGLLIMAALAITGSVNLLTPMNILIYQLIWMVPGFLVTFLTRTI